MVHNAINQLLQSTVWGELDFLIVDLPPGTSDGPLTVMQTLDLDGFVIVTAPQELAMIDAKRSINMIKTLKVDVLGVVENFSGEIFGTGAGQDICDELELPFLGKLGLSPDYRDESKPTVLTSDTVRDEYRLVTSQLELELTKKQTT